VGAIERQLGSLWALVERQLETVKELARNPQLWVILILFAIFVVSIERVEGYITGPWPHQRRGDDRFSSAALGSRSAWLAVGILLMPGLLLAVVNAVVRLRAGGQVGALGLPTNALNWMGLGLVMLSWVIFVAGSSNIVHFGQYLRRVGLIAPAALMVCLLLGDVMLLLALIEATK
jgi:hypothetical protein